MPNIRKNAKMRIILQLYAPTTRVPQGVGWCRGEHRNAVGGIPSIGQKNQFHFKFIKNYQISISCFLIDIESTFKNFRSFVDGSQGFLGTRLFPQKRFSRSGNFPNSYFLKLFGFSCIRWSNSVSPKLKELVLGVMVMLTRSENHENDDFWELWKVKSS